MEKWSPQFWNTFIVGLVFVCDEFQDSVILIGTKFFLLAEKHLFSFQIKLTVLPLLGNSCFKTYTHKHTHTISLKIIVNLPSFYQPCVVCTFSTFHHLESRHDTLNHPSKPLWPQKIKISTVAKFVEWRRVVPLHLGLWGSQ